MAKQRMTVELEDDTIRRLTALGEPIAVLAQLAGTVAESVRDTDRLRRDETDESLRIERHKTDEILRHKADEVLRQERVADETVRVDRARADEIVQTTRRDTDREHPRQATTAGASSEVERGRADHVVQDERSNADAALARERAERRRHGDGALTAGREATDTHLIGERAHSDALIVDQRDANQQMVNATILAQELAVEADAAKQRAERSERELRAVAEFREMFIGVLGHDLRNPLASISMASGLLLERGHLVDQDARTVGRIIRNSERMSRMIMQLLDLTRARLGGGFPIEPTPADLRAICKTVVEDFDAPIELETAGDLTGSWDEDRLAEVLSNLVGNAIRYATPGTAVIVKAHADEAGPVVEIVNQGAPIPADVLPFIFEPFRRARPREKSPTGNLGLGLYIAQQIVLSHGGTLEAHCADGATTFVLHLPRSPPPVRPTPV